MRAAESCAELREAYLTVYGAGCRHGAAGILRDVLAAQAARQTTAGRSLLVSIVGPSIDVDGLLDNFRGGRSLSTESLVPLLADPLGNRGRPALARAAISHEIGPAEDWLDLPGAAADDASTA